MKRLYILITLLVLCLAAHAQSARAINRLFTASFLPEDKTTVTVIEGDVLSSNDISVYRSLVVIDSPDVADKLAAEVAACTKDAVSREVKYIDGRLYYAQYVLAPSDAKPPLNRYLFFLNSHLKGNNRIMLVYIDGSATPEQLKKIINGK